MEDMKFFIYKMWAPGGTAWTAWAKPVLFATLSESESRRVNLPELPLVDWSANLDKSTAIILDLPGEKAVLEALSLAQRGYRPVPLFNGCQAPGMLIDVAEITSLLAPGGAFLSKLEISPDAPPVFMLDARRMERSEMVRPGCFDNRWCVVPQDMPSGKYLKEAGITNVLVRSREIHKDLAYILRDYQKLKIQIQICKDQHIENTFVNIPSIFHGLGYRWSVFRGLRRNATGGFGSIVPEPSSSGMG